MSTFSANPNESPSSQLRLYVGDDAEGGEPLGPAITLRQFFERWFLPIMLSGESRDDKTVQSYRESLAWWATFTGDPPLAQIDPFTIGKFKQGLASATWRRGAHGLLKPLSRYTIDKHLKQVRTVLYCTGQQTDPDRPAAELLPRVPALRIAHPKRHTPKPPFELDAARAIVSATALMPASRKLSLAASRRWWCGLVTVLFYTGLRIGTVLKLRHTMVQERGCDHWLVIPGSIVDKTSKPLEKMLHPLALEAIRRMASAGDAGGLIFTWPHCLRHLNDRHEKLQELAALPRGKWMSPHAWRRTHGTEMARLGVNYGIQIARVALDHEDDRTTRAHYVEIEAELIKKLPLLEPPRSGQKTLF